MGSITPEPLTVSRAMNWAVVLRRASMFPIAWSKPRPSLFPAALRVANTIFS